MVNVSNEKRLGKPISMLYRYSQCFFNIELKPYNLGSGQYMFLLALLENEGINQDQLGKIVRLDKATTTRAVAKLIKQEYVIRKICPNDRRSYLLFPIQKAYNIKDTLCQILNKWNDIILADFTEEEQILFSKLLKKTMHNALIYNLNR